MWRTYELKARKGHGESHETTVFWVLLSSNVSACTPHLHADRCSWENAKEILDWRLPAPWEVTTLKRFNIPNLASCQWTKVLGKKRTKKSFSIPNVVFTMQSVASLWLLRRKVTYWVRWIFSVRPSKLQALGLVCLAHGGIFKTDIRKVCRVAKVSGGRYP